MIEKKSSGALFFLGTAFGGAFGQKIGENGGRSFQEKPEKKIRPRDTKASLGRTDARVQICLQTQTICGMETGMDDCVAAVAAALAAY